MYNTTVVAEKSFKKIALKNYKAWSREGVFCPAFGEKVYFTLVGWNHVVGNDKKHRSVRDVYRRLKLLPLAKDVISKAGTVQSVRTVSGVTTYGLDSIETIEINGVSRITKVRVIIVDTKTGKKFLSIMDRKIK